LFKPAVVTPGGHRRFRPEDVEGFARRGTSVELVSSKEAARLLGVSQPTLNRAVRDGRVRPAAVTPGGHRRFAASELAESRRAAASTPRALPSDWMGC